MKRIGNELITLVIVLLISLSVLPVSADDMKAQDINGLREHFNRARDKTRILAILSPT